MVHVQDGSAPSSPEQTVTLDDLCEVIPELIMWNESATPQVVPGANRAPSPDPSYHYGTPLDIARPHKSEPDLRAKLEQEARANNHCTFMDTPSIPDCLRYSMQVSDSTRQPTNSLTDSLLHPDKYFSPTAFRAPHPQPLPPLPRLVKLEHTSEQQLLHQTQAMCQMDGIMANEIKREFPSLLSADQLETKYPHSFYGHSFPVLGEIEPWLFSNTAFEWEQDNRFSSKVTSTRPSEMCDLLHNDVDQYKRPTFKTEDKTSCFGDDLDTYTKNGIRKDGLIWNDKDPMSTPDVTKCPKLTPARTTRWDNIIKKVPGHRTTFKSGRPRLCQFLLELLEDPDKYSYMIEWLDQERGVFKFVQSGEVARMWGRRRNKPQMKYENFARSLRTYIAKGILTKPRSKLVYRFAKVKN